MDRVSRRRKRVPYEQYYGHPKPRKDDKPEYETGIKDFET